MTYVRKSQAPCEAIEAKKLPALIKNTARYPAEKTTVHHETKTRKRSLSRTELLG